MNKAIRKRSVFYTEDYKFVHSYLHVKVDTFTTNMYVIDMIQCCEIQYDICYGVVYGMIDIIQYGII